jgi:hypothetical protein
MSAPFIAKKSRLRFVQQFRAPPSKVFPLLCPVREYDWIEPWQCELLHSESGVAEKNCIFRTHFPAEPSAEVWTINRHEPDRQIEFIRVNALRVMCLAVALTDNGDGTTTAVNDQLLVALTEQGNQSLESMARSFAFEMRLGEALLNHYLTTGTKLPWQEAVAVASQPR